MNQPSIKSITTIFLIALLTSCSSVKNVSTIDEPETIETSQEEISTSANEVEKIQIASVNETIEYKELYFELKAAYDSLATKMAMLEMTLAQQNSVTPVVEGSTKTTTVAYCDLLAPTNFYNDSTKNKRLHNGSTHVETTEATQTSANALIFDDKTSAASTVKDYQPGEVIDDTELLEKMSNLISTSSDISEIDPSAYMFIIGSFKTETRAKNAIKTYSNKYPDLKGKLHIVHNGIQHRIGFINLMSLEEAVAFKKDFLISHPKFDDAWIHRLIYLL